MYEKEYEQVFENKDENWRKKHDYKKLNKFKDYASKIKDEKVMKKEMKKEIKKHMKKQIFLGCIGQNVNWKIY